MSKKKCVNSEKVYEELCKFLKNCDGDSLAAIYESVFPHVENASYNDISDEIEFDEAGKENYLPNCQME